jgi:predicted HTH domain antitoxin
MQITIDISATLSEQEVREIKYDLAVLLYERGAASLGKAATLAGFTRIEFQRLLAQCGVPLNYGEADLEADLVILRSWPQLR